MTHVQSRLAHGFKARLDSYGGIRAAVRAFGPLTLLDAGLRETWHRFGSFAWRLLPNNGEMDYGWLEAFLFPACDYWIRYQKVLEAISRMPRQEPLEILEVGSGRSGIVLFLKPGTAQVCLVDQTATNVLPRYSAKARYVRADACHLPFADDSFPVVISVDTLEHIPRAARAAFLEELKRVAKEAVILTCPLDSQDGRFQAGKLDAQFRDELRKENRRVPGWLNEHLEHGHPTLEDVTEVLEGAQIEGWQNCESWKRVQSLYLRPFLGFFSGVYYVLALKKNDSSPPHWRGLILWQKRAEHVVWGEDATEDKEFARSQDIEPVSLNRSQPVRASTVRPISQVCEDAATGQRL